MNKINKSEDKIWLRVMLWITPPFAIMLYSWHDVGPNGSHSMSDSWILVMALWLSAFCIWIARREVREKRLRARISDQHQPMTPANPQVRCDLHPFLR